MERIFKYLIVGMLLLLAANVLPTIVSEECFSASSAGYRNVWFVNSSGSIKNTISRASPHDIVVVLPGVYHEHDIVINKSLLLIGAGTERPIIDSDGYTAIRINASHVTVSGFVIKDCDTGILIEPSPENETRYVNIEDCDVISFKDAAIRADGKKHVTPPLVDFVTVHHCYICMESDLNKGIEGRYAGIDRISCCKIEKKGARGGIGIFLDGIDASTIVRNLIENASEGVHINTGDTERRGGTGFFFIHENTIRGNKVGISLPTDFLIALFLTRNDLIDNTKHVSCHVGVHPGTYNLPPIVYLYNNYWEPSGGIPDIKWMNIPLGLIYIDRNPALKPHGYPLYP